MGASAVPIPPVARAPALQCVSTAAPSGTSGSPASPIRRHMARSSSQMAVAVVLRRSQIAAPSPSVSRPARAIRSSAHRRFTAVGRVAASSVTSSSSRATKRSRGAARRSRVPATTPIAAAIPIRGAPRTWSVRIASATASAVSRSRSIRASGSARWSTMRTAPEGDLANQGPFDGKARALRGQAMLRRFETCGKPVVAAINGYALGGGCELAMACHLRIASETARFGQPEVKLGIAPGYGGTQRLPRIVGKGHALHLILTGEMIDAREAYRIGLVNQVVPAAELLATAEKTLRGILAMGPLAVRLALEAVDQGLEMTLDEGLLLEANHFGLLAATEDMKEGLTAFLEKRPPRFRGR